MASLEHVGQVYNKYNVDKHGLKLIDIERTNRQNWASSQRNCQQSVRNCLNDLCLVKDVHQERKLGTMYYLEICSDYIKIFLSKRLSIYERVVLA